MTPTPILIVTGPPASGKSGPARRLADDQRLPLISRDAFSEIAKRVASDTGEGG